MILLVGNYLPDRQQSMLRFAETMRAGLEQRKIPVCLIQPEPILGRYFEGGRLHKWVAYVDKLIFFPRSLRKKIRELQQSHPEVMVHICDHSNSVYTGSAGSLCRVMVTCHDLLAVRGAMGENTDCPASATGRWLQRWILGSLKKADYIVCDSSSTRQDLLTLGGSGLEKKSRVILIFQNFDYQRPADEEIARRLTAISGLAPAEPYLLHVGSNLKRKNRAGILRIVAKIKDKWLGKIVFAGDAPDRELNQLAAELGLTERVVGVAKPDGALLEALYAGAHALLYPSRFEGFGWPIIEAQACGCPVVVSRSTSVPEVAGEGALTREVGDEEGFAEDVLRLLDPELRSKVVAEGYVNLNRFKTDWVFEQYLQAYEEMRRAA